MTILNIEDSVVMIIDVQEKLLNAVFNKASLEKKATTLANTAKEIIDNGYDLSINKYKEIEYVPVEYPPSEEIIANIEALELEIQKNLAELKDMLKE